MFVHLFGQGFWNSIPKNSAHDPNLSYSSLGVNISPSSLTSKSLHSLIVSQQAR